MHLLRSDQRSMDEAAEAVDLEQSPADVVFLSFTQSDLGLIEGQAAGLPYSLRLASLADLKHPFSVDLYLDKVCRHARFVLVRLLGGLDYWRYGVDELAALCRTKGITLAVIAGDHRPDSRLMEASTLDAKGCDRLWAYMQHGGPDNIRRLLRFIGHALGHMDAPEPPEPMPEAGLHAALSREGAEGSALIILYRSTLLADDLAPFGALADALAQEGIGVRALYVTSLKDPQAQRIIRRTLAAHRPDIILNTTAFSARLDDGTSVLDEAGCPVLQLVMATCSHAQWTASARGLSATDLAMAMALPELDGRLEGGLLSFKEAGERNEAVQFSALKHRTDPSFTRFIARRAKRHIALRHKANGTKQLALILSDYPQKGGRAGYTVGLDAPRSVETICERLMAEGYALRMPPQDLMPRLSMGEALPTLTLEAYRRCFAALPQNAQETMLRRWGAPGDDAAVVDGCFHHRFVELGALTVALQPPRGGDKRENYHNCDDPPSHAYLAFYLWLRMVKRIDALIHLGTHGTTEWLSGKAAALSEACAPRIVIDDIPVIYPFIVNNPGEATQAKRRIGALTLGHLTPPLTEAGVHGPLADIEGLFDEYAQALDLDPPRAKQLGALILERAAASGLLKDVAADGPDNDQLAALDGWLCDIKEMRIGDGLHVFGAISEGMEAGFDTTQHPLLLASPQAEMDALMAALGGRFVRPGPAGAPQRGRTDVLPTGRNLTSLDPRAIPTRTAYDIGLRAAEAVIGRYLQDHGDYPRSLMLDLWASAQMRTGGDDIAQAFALLGVKPLWDHGSHRVNGFEVLPLATIGRPRIDVSLRISGLFRDVFAQQIALFAQAVKAVMAQDDEDETDNPLKGVADGLRVFGQSSGYGTGLSAQLQAGAWSTRHDLAETYIAASSFAFDSGDAVEARAAFEARVREADAFVHVADLEGQDILNADAHGTHEGGFASAAALLGGKATLYHVDAANRNDIRARTLKEELSRVLHGRAVNPRWLKGQMRHGWRGAAEMAETVENLFNFAALTLIVEPHHFDALFDATLGDEAVRAFLARENPPALQAMADKFSEALERGLWQSRRNHVLALLPLLQDRRHG